MRKKPQTSFNKLKAHWYKKLEQSGFEDIESDEHNLKEWSHRFTKESPTTWQAKEAYYYMAETFLNEYQFESSLERIIWEYHANAISCRDIVTILKKTKVMKTNRTTVWQIIKILEDVMKKHYMVNK